MRSCGVFWILPRPFGDGSSSGRCESGAGEDPRTIRQRMDRFDLSGFSRQPERLGRDLQDLCGQIGAWIEKEFGHVYAGRSGPIALLHRLEIEYHKAEMIRSKL